ncbi:hypothetical protein WJX73_004646 [Symbiochloris irregularis]|uniref:RecA family profile 1 domain-containing protein n=1 Tax=Symbiochloris irregularis TaxID=706552 RepID=A0AAW1NYW8_9CHLO
MSSKAPQDAAQRAVLYVSGEESAEQVASRGQRMGLAINHQELFVYSATCLDDIMKEMEDMHPQAVIIDSIQTVYLEGVSGSAGGVTQVQACATALLQMAKKLSTPIFMVGHMNKAGDIAGPRVLEHVVDVVLLLEGERYQSLRLLRGMKNRHGATDEVGVFQMQEEGLMPVADPSVLFVSDRSLAAVGGMKVMEPAADLAIAMAIVSSLKDRPTPTDCAFVGEIGLGGELRNVPYVERRIMEAAKLGYASIIVALPRGQHVLGQAE